MSYPRLRLAVRDGSLNKRLLQAGIRFEAYRVLMVLSCYANENGIAWPNRETIASRAAMTERSVRRALKLLVTAGFLELAQAGRPGRPPANWKGQGPPPGVDAYRVTLDDPALLAPGSANNELARRGSENGAQGTAEMARESAKKEKEGDRRLNPLSPPEGGPLASPPGQQPRRGRRTRIPHALRRADTQISRDPFWYLEAHTLLKTRGVSPDEAREILEGSRFSTDDLLKRVRKCAGRDDVLRDVAPWLEAGDGR